MLLGTYYPPGTVLGTRYVTENRIYIVITHEELESDGGENNK